MSCNYLNNYRKKVISICENKFFFNLIIIFPIYLKDKIRKAQIIKGKDKMTIEKMTKNIKILILFPEPDLSKQLQELNGMISQRWNYDLLVDFSQVEVINSSNLSNLMILDNWVRGCGHRLILFNLNFSTKCLFKTAGLESKFEIANDKTSALHILEQTHPINN